MPGRIRDPGPLLATASPAAVPADAGGRRGEPTGPYEGWTVAQLRARAAAAGIGGRSRMRKDDLIRALRSS